MEKISGHAVPNEARSQYSFGYAAAVAGVAVVFLVLAALFLRLRYARRLFRFSILLDCLLMFYTMKPV
jgi:hypothetical protein